MSAVLDELSSTIGGIADRVGPSVVGIGRGWGVGSGVVVAEGRVLTNAHNLRRDETTVRFADGRRERGRVAGADADNDLAVIEVDTGDAPALDWGDPEAAGIGTPVFALANPGGRGLRVTFGTVSSANRSFRGPAAAASRAPSSTPRPCRAARPAARSSTATGACSASTASAWTAT